MQNTFWRPWCTAFNASKSAHMFISSKHRQSGDATRSSLSMSDGTTLAKKKNHHRDSRREERCSTCDIMLDQARSAQGKSDPRLSATFALRWSRLIEHDITRGTAFFSPRISRMVLFFGQGSIILFPWWGRLLISVFGSQALVLSPREIMWSTSFNGSSSKVFAETPGSSSRRDLLTLLSGYTVVSSVLCLSMLRLFGIRAPNMTRLPWSASICWQLELFCMSTVVRCTTSMCWPPSLSRPILAWRCCYQKLCLLRDLLHGGGAPSLRGQVPSPVFSLFLLFPQPLDAISSVVPYFSSFEVFSSFFCCSV